MVNFKIEKQKLTQNELNIVEERLNEIGSILSIKYPRYLIFLLLSLEFLILFVIYLYEDYGFSVIFKVLTIVPIWLLLTKTILYYQKRIPAKRLFKLYNPLITNGFYNVFQIRTEKCEKIGYEDQTLYAFHLSGTKRLILQAEDFEIDSNFPSNDFLIPPKEIFEIVGNKIENRGNKITSLIENTEWLSHHFASFRLFEKGKFIIVNK
jgi:hypothetical protein